MYEEFRFNKGMTSPLVTTIIIVIAILIIGGVVGYQYLSQEEVREENALPEVGSESLEDKMVGWSKVEFFNELHIITGEAVAFNDNLYVANFVLGAEIGDNKIKSTYYIHSFDGNDWKESFRLEGDVLVTAFGVFDDKLYMTVISDKYGVNSQLYVFDNSSWSKVIEIPSSYLEYLEAYNDKLYITARDPLKIYEFDGFDIEEITLPESSYKPSQVFSSEIYNDKIYFLVNSLSMLVFDGKKWSWDDNPLWLHALKEYNDKLYAGKDNDIFVLDNNDWEKIYTNKPIDESTERIKSFTVFNNKLYVKLRYADLESYGSTKVLEYDGISWELKGLMPGKTIESFSIYNDRLYALVFDNIEGKSKIYILTDEE